MSLALETSALSAHVRFPSREGVADALGRLDLVKGAPVAVWPPRRLPFGIYVSPERNGWVSLWSPLDNVRDWFSRLTATLEAPGVILEVVESRFWIAEFFQDERFLGRVELPSADVEYDDLWARTVESLEAEGLSEPWEDEQRFGERMDEIARSEEYAEVLEQLRAERPEKEALIALLPPHAHLEQAWELLWAIDREREEVGPDEWTRSPVTWGSGMPPGTRAPTPKRSQKATMRTKKGCPTAGETLSSYRSRIFPCLAEPESRLKVLPAR